MASFDQNHVSVSTLTDTDTYQVPLQNKPFNTDEFILSKTVLIDSLYIHESSIHRLGKNQDEAYTISDQTGSKGALFDGHGDYSCIKTIRGANVPIILQLELDPLLTLKLLTDDKNLVNRGSGSTAVYGYLSSSSVDISSCGDSKAYVFINGILVYTNIGHTWHNESERLRLEGKVSSSNDPYIKVIDDDTITQSQDGWRTRFPGGLALAPSQSLGHHGITGYEPETTHIPFELGSLVRVVLVSDGVSDMLHKDSAKDNVALLTLNAEDLAQYAENKWSKSWTVLMSSGKTYPNYHIPRDQFDDISVVVLQNYE